MHIPERWQGYGNAWYSLEGLRKVRTVLVIASVESNVVWSWRLVLIYKTAIIDQSLTTHSTSPFNDSWSESTGFRKCEILDWQHSTEPRHFCIPAILSTPILSTFALHVKEWWRFPHSKSSIMHRRSITWTLHRLLPWLGGIARLQRAHTPGWPGKARIADHLGCDIWHQWHTNSSQPQEQQIEDRFEPQAQ